MPKRKDIQDWILENANEVGLVIGLITVAALLLYGWTHNALK